MSLAEFDRATIEDHPSLWRPFEALEAEWLNDDRGRIEAPHGRLGGRKPGWLAVRTVAADHFDMSGGASN